MIHIRTRLTADFTVISNALAQRRGSAVTIGVAAYILSLPDGAPVSIAALCEHFTEGEILISRALRELEAAGYLERRRERGPGGLVRTRTYFRDVPKDVPKDAPQRGLPKRQLIAPPPRPRKPAPPAPEPEHGATEPTEAAEAVDGDEQAVALLASLRIADPRLILSRREVAQLAPAVARWFAVGVGPRQLTSLLTTGLPDRFLARPSRILTFRLSEPPPAVAPAPAPHTPPPTPPRTPPPVLPWQTCDGCERAFRAAEPALCRDCGLKEGAVAVAA
ncbi:hypothetical protein SPAR_10257 [Streptomyces sparsogenes DSM 40356]|uniref:DNA-binding protein n=1 Tax=Streptomyces sparsogenes DSM 40356 TaxID=1331668 RepID=A0A1R1SMP1_9ACTN|nr:hypothetical protein SPAR_10257 [Streptomyces sparsogenes DSM 40356]